MINKLIDVSIDITGTQETITSTLEALNNKDEQIYNLLLKDAKSLIMMQLEDVKKIVELIEQM